MRFYTHCVLLAGSLVLSACDGHGVERVVMGDGTAVYFKREVRGSNYDSLWISTDPDPCKPRDPSRDYEFPELGPVTVYCRPGHGEMETYSTGELDTPDGAVELRVVHQVLDPLSFQTLEKTYASRGLTKIDVQVQWEIRCR